MRILVINGPNMNMLGIRQPEIYGKATYEDLKAMIQQEADTLGVEVSFFQSNHEGALVDAIQQAYFDKIDGIVINPGAYTHTSVALLDAVKAVSIPTVDIGLPQLAMHSCYETGAVADALALEDAMTAYYGSSLEVSGDRYLLK